MTITVNGEQRDVPAGLTIAALVAHLGLDEGPVAVERNRRVVPRAEHDATRIEEGDELEVVHFVGGG